MRVTKRGFLLFAICVIIVLALIRIFIVYEDNIKKLNDEQLRALDSTAMQGYDATLLVEWCLYGGYDIIRVVAGEEINIEHKSYVVNVGSPVYLRPHMFYGVNIVTAESGQVVSVRLSDIR